MVRANHRPNFLDGKLRRDIKPGNIMLERRPEGVFWPYLMDFGLAREVDSNTQTSTGGVEGTPAFMAPEQARGEVKLLDARTDVYGLGATLYAALAGRPPFVGNSTDVLMAVLLNEPPRLRTLDPAIPSALETIVLKCLEKEPRRRYPSAKALAEDLERYLEGARISARPPGILRRAGRFAQRHKLLMASAATALLATVVLGGVALRIRLQATQQARLAQQLGQEITKMEWILRSARQLPLHAPEREKAMVRKRMAQLQAELSSYGQLSQGLVHYALGRGHMTLREYPQALVELEQAQKLGVQSAELHYALGIVLGKHFEQAMYEARLSGGGDWAKKQLKEIEPKYLTPAIAALQSSRLVQIDAPQYLEALIAYYQRDYDTALRQADAAVREVPWLYEATKLAGDVHHERALQARDSGRYEEAEREFADAVKSYEAAAAAGQSDGEVYEGLAESWVRQIETAMHRSRPYEAAYAAAMSAIKKLSTSEPESIAGPLKESFAAMMTMIVTGTRTSSMERVRQCLGAADTVLAKQPGHPYASEAAAACYNCAADSALLQGRDPEPFLRRAFELLEPTVKRYPNFLWGQNDLGTVMVNLAMYLQRRGRPGAKELIHKSLEHYAAALRLDSTYLAAQANILYSLIALVPEARSDDELRGMLVRADDSFAKCKITNVRELQCFDNYFQVYGHAAKRTFLAGEDANPWLQRAFENLVETRKLGDNLLDIEQIAALLEITNAANRVRHKQDPSPGLVEMEADLTRCFSQAPQDATCRTLAAQAEWVRADWLASQGKPFTMNLEAALEKAQLATKSPEIYPDAWQTLAESHLRLARALEKQPKLRDQHVAAGLDAVAKAFAINPNHALGLFTQGALLLLRAQTERDRHVRRAIAQSAAQALERAIQSDPFLTHDTAPLLERARAIDTPAN